jgi:hypothetical protein
MWMGNERSVLFLIPAGDGPGSGVSVLPSVADRRQLDATTDKVNGNGYES